MNFIKCHVTDFTARENSHRMTPTFHIFKTSNTLKYFNISPIIRFLHII